MHADFNYFSANNNPIINLQNLQIQRPWKKIPRSGDTLTAYKTKLRSSPPLYQLIIAKVVGPSH